MYAQVEALLRELDEARSDSDRLAPAGFASDESSKAKSGDRESRRCSVERNQILDWTRAVEQAVERRRNKVIVPRDGAL